MRLASVFSMAIWLAMNLPLSQFPSVSAEADDLINKDLVFRTKILDQPAPPELKVMIDGGDVTITFVSDLGEGIGETRYFMDLDWTYDYKMSVAKDGERRILSLAVSNIKLDFKLRHVMRLPKAYCDPRVWRSQLLRHEFDHVAISLDPRPVLLLNHLCQQISTIEQELKVEGDPATKFCQELINAAIRRRQKAIIELVKSNYLLLDKVSRHGMDEVPNRETFFSELYTKRNLAEQRFRFADQADNLLETPKYRRAKPRNLAKDPTVPLR